MKKHFVHLLAALSMCAVSAQSLAQISPGGVGTGNLTAWFRADDLPSGNVTNWSTTFPTGGATLTLSDAQSPYAQLETTPNGAVSNYNRTLHFSGNSFIGLNNATLQGLSLVPAPDLLDNAYSGNQGSFFTAYYLPQPPSNNGHLLMYNEGNDAIQCRNLTNTGRIALGLLSSNSVNASRDWQEDFLPNITSYRGNRSSFGSMNGYNKGALLPTPTVASQSSGPGGLYIGYAPTIGSSAYNGYMHEFIFFDRDLTALEMSQVHTYLAVKYGVTLNNAGGGINGDYVATNGQLIWDASNQAAYHQDVIGIGRDDLEGLNQRQSHAFDDSTRIYLNDLAAQNELNAGSFTSDISYLLMGHNSGRLCGTVASANEVPTTISSRIEREFKCTKTNFPQTFNWDLRIDTCSAFSTSMITENLRLLVDSDGDFTNAQIFDNTDGITFSFNGDVLTVNGISDNHFPNNSTRFLTIGYIDVNYALNSSDPLCNGDTGWIIFEVFNTTNPIDITYSDGQSLLTVSAVTDGDTLFLTPAQTTVYTFQPTARPFNCCAVTTGSDLSVTITQPDVILVNTSNDTTICENGTISMWADASYPSCNYHWNFTSDLDSNQNHSPLSDFQYEVYAENSDGCLSDVEVINVSIRPSLSGTPTSDVTICPGYPTTIGVNSIAGGLAPYDIQWSSGEQGQGTAMNIQANPPTTTTYTATISDACESTPLQLDVIVTVAALPIPVMGVVDSSICEPASFTLTNQTDPNMVASLTWILSDGQFFIDQETVTTAPMPAGSYDVQLIVVSPEGCIDSITNHNYLTVYPLPIANFQWSPNPVQMFNTTVAFQNQSTLGHTYEWFFEEGDTPFSILENPSTQFPDGETGNYDVTLITMTEYGCTDTVTHIVNVLPEVLIFVPNTFTPDGDEFNQQWAIFIEGIDVFDFTLQLFNRWGELVWESHDPKATWDGTYKGQLVPIGTYSWVIEARDAINDNKHIWNGHLNVLK